MCIDVFTNTTLWNPQKVAVVQWWLLFGGFSIKIVIKTCLAGFGLAVVDWSSLFGSGR
jgi:hypothetical protein